MSSIEFIRRYRVPGEVNDLLKVIANCPKTAPVGIVVGTELEIQYSTYVVIAVNPIVHRVDNNFEHSEIVYQIHVRDAD